MINFENVLTYKCRTATAKKKVRIEVTCENNFYLYRRGRNFAKNRNHLIENISFHSVIKLYQNIS